MLFIVLLVLTTIAIAASAAFFSVYGMAQLFAGAFVPVIIMGASLEAGKLVAASFLYRYAKEIGLALKVYLMSAIFILMLITSMGIFGFLTAAYQKDTIPLAEMQQKIELYDTEYQQLIERRTQIDQQIAAINPDYVTVKQRLVKDFAPEREAIDARLQVLTPELQKLKTDQIDVEAKIGPIMFVAEVMGEDPKTAVFWFVVLLISVFDPLAVALTIATNVALQKRKEEQVKKQGPVQEVKLDSLKKYIDKQISKNSVVTETPPVTPIIPQTWFLP